MNQPNDDKLERELEGLSRSYREHSVEEPPGLVDQAVLNRARRAASVPVRRPWSFGWVHGLTTAAIVVLGVAIVFHQPDPGPVETLRVMKPPSPKLRDTASEFQPLRIPARQPEAESTEAASREIRRQVMEKSEADAAGYAQPAPAAILQQEEQRSRIAADVMVAEDALDDAGEPAESPERWLARILELYRQGQEEAARRELADFRQAWPDYPLPAELQD